VGSPFTVNGEENVRTVSQAGQGGSSARIVGALTRNAQSQWVVQSPAPDTGPNPTQLSQIAFQPATAWLTGATEPEQEANAHIARLMFPENAPPDLRARYQEIGENWSNRSAELSQSKYDYPSGGTPLFDSTTYSRVKSQLQTEMQYVADVNKSITNFQKILGSAEIDSIVNETTIANSIIDSIEPPLKSETFVDPTAILGNFLNVASAVSVFGGEEAAPVTATLGAMANGMLLAESMVPTTTASGGTPVSQAISDEAGKVAASVESHYKTVGEAFEHLYALMVSDWGKLQAAEAASGVWNDAPQDLIEQTFATTDKQAYVRGLMPVAFHNYRIHPAISNANKTPWLAQTYRCLNDGSPLTKVFAGNSKNESGRAGEVRWRSFKPFGLIQFDDGGSLDPGPPQGSEGWVIGQALSTKIDWGNEQGGIVNSLPRLPPASLMNSIFSRITRNTGDRGVNPAGNPGPLQMDKPHFFGSNQFQRHGITCRYADYLND
jgi:hypothetical protein